MSNGSDAASAIAALNQRLKELTAELKALRESLGKGATEDATITDGSTG